VWHSGVAFWEDIIKKAPHKARGYNNYGVNLLSEQNDVQKAIWAFKRAIQLEPTTYPDPYNNISAAFALTNRLDLAVQALRASLHINPYQHKAYNNIGIYLMQKNFDDLAEKAFKQAIMIYPHYGKAYFNLGRLYLKQKRMNDAWQSFKNACTVADYDNHAECITAYAQTSMNLKKFEEVINAYELLAKVQKLNPDDILSLADAHAMLEQYDQAEPRYIQVLDCQDCAVHANHNLCELYCRQRNYSQALATIMHLEQQHLSYPDLPIRKAECLYHTGNRTQARALLQEFTKITRNFNLRVAAQRLLSKMN
jgi:tetratricopeptide (TPR) repeat protein